MLMVIALRELLRNDFDVDLPISGGDGDSLDTPIVIDHKGPNDYVAIEYKILECLGIGRGIDWKIIQQTLIKHGERTIDQIKIEARWTTKTKVITERANYYFDITECFGGVKIER